MSAKNTRKKKKQLASKSKQSARSLKNKTRLWLGTLVAIFAFLLYANTISHEYALDDASVITDNYVTKSGTGGIYTLLTTHYRFGYWGSKGTLYRPLSLIVFAVAWDIAPDNPAFYHLINVLLYAVLGFLLFWTLSMVFRAYHLLYPLLITLFFIAHPVHTEVVANIKSMDEILAFFFCISTVYFLWKYLDEPGIWCLLGMLLSFTLALFSKETAITFIAVLFLLVYFFRIAPGTKGWLAVLLCFLPIGVYLIVRMNVLGDVVGMDNVSVLDNFLRGAGGQLGAEKASAFLMLGYYLKALIFPFWLVSDMGYNQVPLTSWGDWRVILVFLFAVGSLGYAVWRSRQKDPVAFGILYFAVTFSVFSNLVLLIGTSYGERLLFMPSLGFAVVLTFLLVQRNSGGLDSKDFDVKQLWNHNKVVLIVGIFILSLYAVRTMSRNPAWKNSYELYAADVKHSVNSSKLHYHYGLEVVQKALKESDTSLAGQLMDHAVEEFKTAMRIYPSYHDAYSQLGLAYYRKGNNELAIKNYETSLKYKPDNAKVYSNMGIIYFSANNIEKAKEVYEKAVSLDPRFVDARQNLGSVYAMMKQYDKAIEQYQEALKYEPDNAKIHFFIGNAYRDMGQAQLGQPFLNKAYQLDPAMRKLQNQRDNTQ